MDKDEYETIIFEHDFQKEKIIKALEIVKMFIIRNKRILVGGMAIDLSLRSKKLKLYADNKLPDYDFYSPNFHIDAYNLGIELVDAGLEGISVIRGMHVSTMRVRVNFIPVADITYIPENIYNEIPTIKYNHFIIVHPHYQIIDQHRALSLPFENPPNETIINRWEKDIKRNTLLFKNFPIEEQDIKMIYNVEYNIPIDILKDVCLSGIIGLSYWHSESKKDGILDENLLDNDYDMNNLFIKLKCPKNIGLMLLTENIEIINNDYFKNYKVKYYNPVLDKIPRLIQLSNKDSIFNFIDTKGQLVSAYNNGKFYISNLQNILCYFLTYGILYRMKEYINLYLIGHKIIKKAAKEYSKNPNDKLLKYLPSIDTYGKYNWSESYQIMRRDAILVINEKQKANDTPKNAYPDKNKPIKEELYNFIPNESEHYQFDGLECKEFKEKELY